MIFIGRRRNDVMMKCLLMIHRLSFSLSTIGCHSDSQSLKQVNFKNYRGIMYVFQNGLLVSICFREPRAESHDRTRLFFGISPNCIPILTAASQIIVAYSCFILRVFWIQESLDFDLPQSFASKNNYIWFIFWWLGFDPLWIVRIFTFHCMGLESDTCRLWAAGSYMWCPQRRYH